MTKLEVLRTIVDLLLEHGHEANVSLNGSHLFGVVNGYRIHCDGIVISLYESPGHRISIDLSDPDSMQQLLKIISYGTADESV